MPRQDLTHSSGAMTVQDGCSKDLFALLTSSGQTEDVVRDLAVNPDARAAVEAARNTLEARRRPCGAEGVAKLLLPLVGVYGLADRSSEEWGSFWSGYIKTLGELPYEALESAVTQHLRDGDYFPKPSQLYRLARPVAERIWQASYRANKVLDYQARPVPTVTDEDRERVRRLLADFRMSPRPVPVDRETRMAERLRRMP